jgi:hypothetical protein
MRASEHSANHIAVRERAVARKDGGVPAVAHPSRQNVGRRIDERRFSHLAVSIDGRKHLTALRIHPGCDFVARAEGEEPRADGLVECVKGRNACERLVIRERQPLHRCNADAQAGERPRP